MRIGTIVALVSAGACVGLSVEACGPSAVPAASAKVGAPLDASVAVRDAGVVDAGDAVDASALASLDALASRATSVAAGMREVARGEIAGDAADAKSATRVVARADDRDVCVRVTLVARSAVHAWLTDSRGDVLAEERDALDATLGARGPVCVRKGDAVTLRVEAGTPVVARFVAWESP